MIFQIHALTFRQQFFKRENEKLAKLLGFELGQKVRNFDVFVFEYCDGNIQGCHGLKLSEAKSICHQLLEGLEQLEKSKKCHNDLKPENILYKISEYPDDDGNDQYVIKIGDFGTEGKNGGTPGWTWPKFMSERKPGRSDMYSVGLLILYVMCESDELFYCIRNNYVRTGQSWLPEFRNIPLIKLVIQMMNLELSVQECIKQWEEISEEVEIISKSYLESEYGIDVTWLELRGETESNIIDK